ncbi:uncharacterized protein LOC121382340 [Gigantopelta aegis]|uniref:uncharacterized protein LOC121382340 n=1 Tax=Gigantopelta aegis TaxID=1735272 RepID=UPI001B88DDE2|nr:uncharacterized protein LOC121382340 [Gigantopelta aegis]
MKLSLMFVVLLGICFVCSEAYRGWRRRPSWGHHGRRNRQCQKRIQRLKEKLDCLKARLSDCQSRTTITTTTKTPTTTTTTTTAATNCPLSRDIECLSIVECKEYVISRVLLTFSCEYGKICCKKH